MSNSDRFLQAFTTIEQYLRKKSGLGRDSSFPELVKAVSKSNPVIRNREDDLRQFAELRNAMVHIRRGNDVFSLAETPISQVLEYVEDEDNYRFVSRNKSLLEVLQLFEDYAGSGRRLEAVLITDSGKPNEKLLGIVTIYDLPDAPKELRVQSG